MSALVGSFANEVGPGPTGLTISGCPWAADCERALLLGDLPGLRDLASDLAGAAALSADLPGFRDLAADLTGAAATSCLAFDNVS